MTDDATSVASALYGLSILEIPCNPELIGYIDRLLALKVHFASENIFRAAAKSWCIFHHS